MLTTVAALYGRRIIVTRPEREHGPLSKAIAGAGGSVLYAPMLRIRPIAFRVPDAAEIAATDIVVFTSANAVRHFAEKLASTALQELTRNSGIAAVGPATARALADLGCMPALIAHEHVAEALVSELGFVGGKRILWPRGDNAREVLSLAARRHGAILTELVVYRTVADMPTLELEALSGADAITFTSPSAVRAWYSAFGRPACLVACIGPVTAQAAAEHGIEVAAVADTYTLEGLVESLGHLLHPVNSRPPA